MDGNRPESKGGSSGSKDRGVDGEGLSLLLLNDCVEDKVRG